MSKEVIETDKGAALGYSIKLGNAKLLLIEADLGYIACGYINPDTVRKLEDTAVIISKVNNFDEILKEQPTYVSEKARELGINMKMTGRQCLNRLIKEEEKDLDRLIKKEEDPGEIQI